MAPAIEEKTSFVFVPNNGRGVDAASRKSIRAHAMNMSLRQRLAGVKLTGSDSKLQYQTGRFRLADSATKVETKLFKVKRSAPRKPTKRKTESSKAQVVSMTEISEDNDVLVNTQSMRFTNQHLPSIPSPGRYDPFDSLPILFERRQHQILSYYESSFHQNTLAFNSDKRLVSLASFDPAWLHSTFSIIALNLAFAQGIPGGVSLAALYHRGKALEMVNERLRSEPAAIPDTTLGAIASLANFEMTIGSLLPASAHVKGLEQLVRLRGWNRESGIPANLGLLHQVLAWTDLCFSGLTLGKPMLKTTENTSQPKGHLHTGYDTEVSSTNNLPIRLTDVLCRLRSLTHLMDRGKLSNKEQQFFTSTIYSTQYQLIAFQGKYMFDTDNRPDPYSKNIQHHEKATSLAFLIYINMILRKIPSNSAYHSVFAKHIRSSLEASGDFLTLAWASNLKILFWILFIAAIVTSDRSERSFFTRNLALVGGELALTNMGELMNLLRETVWSETFYSPQIATTWREMSNLLAAFSAWDEMVGKGTR